MRTGFVFVISVLSLLSLSTVTAQSPKFQAIALQQEPRYHVDWSQYFATSDMEVQKRAAVLASLERYRAGLPRITSSARLLYQALIHWDSLLISLNRHYIYHNLKVSVNWRDEPSQHISQRLGAALDETEIGLQRVLAQLSKAKVNQFIRELPALKAYRYFIDRNQREQPHWLRDESGSTLAKVSPLIVDWQYDLYETITRTVDFPWIIVNGQSLNTRTNRVEIAQHADSAVRASGFHQYYNALNTRRDLYAFTLKKVVQAHHELATFHQYEDALTASYFTKFETKASIHQLLKRLIDSVSIYKEYQQARVNYLKRTLGYSTLHYWDLEASPSTYKPQFPIDSARLIIQQALLPLGPDYQAELTKLLDPGNGRLEIAPGKDKRGGGFSRGFIGTPSIFYTGGYKGTYNDVRLLTHESTHAVHRELMNQFGVRPVYASGPNYFFESFAIFSEFLLIDYLLKHASSRQAKLYYLEQHLANKGLIAFYGAQDALLEQAIHESIVQGKVTTADQLDSLNGQINSIFSIWPSSSYPELKQRWQTNVLFYEDPLYNVNYVLGVVLALTYYQLYQQNPVLFQQQYTALLKNGFTQPPAPLIKQFLGIELTDPLLLTKVIPIMRQQVVQLKALYTEE